MLLFVRHERDTRITDFLGYLPTDIEGLSAYQFHHAQDNDVILKSYKTSEIFLLHPNHMFLL